MLLRFHPSWVDRDCTAVVDIVEPFAFLKAAVLSVYLQIQFVVRAIMDEGNVKTCCTRRVQL
jgi:hypothetical protein